MPKESIYSSTPGALYNSNVQVGWTKGVAAYVSTVDPQNPSTLEYQTATLGPKEIDKLIKVLRRAKKQAYGT